MRIDEGGHWAIVATLGRIDLALRYAEVIAESYARNDHDRCRRGVPCSGTRAIVMDHDVWEIVHAMTVPWVLTIPSSVPAEHALLEAFRLLRLTPI